jgi:hypothetical protein
VFAHSSSYASVPYGNINTFIAYRVVYCPSFSRRDWEAHEKPVTE